MGRGRLSAAIEQSGPTNNIFLQLRIVVLNPGSIITPCRCQAGGSKSGDSAVASLREATLAAELPSSPLASFPAIFRQSLALGTLSRRRVLERADAYQVDMAWG